MNAAARRTSTDRDRAVARLRSITIGTGLAGVVALGGFGAIAAASSDGSPSTDGTLTAATTTAATPTTSTGSTSTTTSGSGSIASDATAGPTGLAPTAAPTTTSGPAHASTGGS